MIEQEMVVMSAKALEEYQAKHSAEEPIPQVKFFSANVPDNSFYREKIKTLEKENEALRKQIKNYECERKFICKEWEKKKGGIEQALEDKDERIRKLEAALVEATLK